jgi:uncharacterized protein YdhG (YjbR/CyaY superfamily)
MRTNPTAPKDIDEYIAGFPNDVQEILDKIRMTIRKAAPDAEETITANRGLQATRSAALRERLTRNVRQPR